MNPSLRLQHNFFLLLLIGAGIIMFFLWRPFIAPLVLAGSFAIVFYPMYEWIKNKVGGRQNVAAFASVGVIVLAVVTPLIAVSWMVFVEARELYFTLASGGGLGLVSTLIEKIEKNIRVYMPDANVNVAEYAQSGVQWVVTHFGDFFSGFIGIVIGAVIMLVALFFLFRDGGRLREKLFILSPLDHKYDAEIMRRVSSAVSSVMKGSMLIALVQGSFAAVGFFATGVPNPVLWSVAATLSSLVPGVGTSIVTFPAIILLFATKPLWFGLGLLIWATLGIGLIDNALSPLILNRGLKVHPFLILISVLGGLSFFGPVGFILGPIILAFFFALLDIYPLIISERL